jgi:hypothetical protein
MSKRNEDENEVAVDTGTETKKRRRLGPNPRPPSQWDTPSTGSGWGPPGISPVPPSLWPLPQAGESLGFGGATAERKSALDIANELAMAAETDRRASSALRGTNLEARARPSYLPPGTEQSVTQTLQDILNQYQFDPSPYAFDSTPYDNYLNFLIEQDTETQARIQAMYAELADTAQANIDRVGEIYQSGTANLGDVYGSSYGAVEDAYSSAQQQAADQMARLGIEAAAPAVMDPMALSQAEALSGIESQRASGLGATQQYGTTAQDFSSQMQQVAQQQGLEVTSSIIAQMAQRQAEAAFMREQARAEADRELRQAQASFNPYAQAMQRMQAEMMFREMSGAGERESAELIMRAEQLAYDRTMSQQEKLDNLTRYILDLDAKTTGKGTLQWQEAIEIARGMLQTYQQTFPYQF